MNFTLNNHLKYYINNEMYGIRKNAFDKYRVEVGKIDHSYYAKGNLYTEIIKIADLIKSQLGKDFEMYFSGGTDCEIVIKSFLAIGVKPKIVTIRYTDGMNEFEVETAKKIVSELNLKQEIVNFDVRDFYFSGSAINLAQKIYCSQLNINGWYEIIRRRQTPTLMAGNIPLTKKIGNFDPYWYYTHMESEESCNVRFYNVFKIPVIHEFFSYTPEAMLYWLESQEIKDLVTKKNFKAKVESSKNQFLKNLLPEFDLVLRTKTHGWEKTIPFLSESNRHIFKFLTQRLTGCLDGIEYNSIIKQLKGDI